MQCFGRHACWAVIVSASRDFARATIPSLGTLDATTDGTISSTDSLRTTGAMRGPVKTFELRFQKAATAPNEIRRVLVEFRRLQTLT